MAADDTADDTADRPTGTWRRARDRGAATRLTWLTVGFALGAVFATGVFLATGPDDDAPPEARSAPGTATTSPTAEPEPTATPTPTFTPPDPADRPGPDSTGVDPDTELREVPGGTLDQDGLVLEDAVIRGEVELTGSNQTLRNVRVEGHLGILATGVVIEDVEAASIALSDAADVVIRRVEVYGREGSDGIHLTSDRGRVTDVLIEDSWVHSPQVTGGSHYDGIQVRGVERLTLRGNYFDLGDHNPQLTAAIFVEEANGGNVDVLLERNWIDGGGYAVNLSGTGITVRDNYFGRQAPYGLFYPDARQEGFEEDGNRWADSGEPVILRRD